MLFRKRLTCLAYGIPLPSEGWRTPPVIWAGQSLPTGPTGTPRLDFYHVIVLNVCSHFHLKSSLVCKCWIFTKYCLLSENIFESPNQPFHFCFLPFNEKSWKQFESDRQSVWRFISHINSELQKKHTFSCLDVLKSELEQSKVCV